MSLNDINNKIISDAKQKAEEIKAEIKTNSQTKIEAKEKAFSESVANLQARTDQNIARLKDALGLFEQDGDIRGMLLCTGFLIEAAVFIRQPSDRILGESQMEKSVGDQVVSASASSRVTMIRAIAVARPVVGSTSTRLPPSRTSSVAISN